MDPDSCFDCGRERETSHGIVHGFCSVITNSGQSRWFCFDCKTRRGLAYLFDDRRWAEIEREQKGSAA